MNFKRAGYRHIFLFLFLFAMVPSWAIESHFYRLDREEFLAKVPSLVKEAEELRSWQKRLGIADENCLCYLEEISLSEAERPETTEIYHHLPTDEHLPHTYRQPIAIKILGNTVRFAQDYDYNPSIQLRQLPYGFLLKQVLSAQEKSSGNRLLLPANFSCSFVSLCFVPRHSLLGADQSARIALILHRIVGERERSTGIASRQVRESGGGDTGGTGTTADTAEISWGVKEPILFSDPLASIPSFLLETPLSGRPISEIPHIALKLEDSQLKSSDGSPFVFPVGEHILDIRLDGIIFPVFWHQKENSPPYRVFFFNGNVGRPLDEFHRMTYLRAFNVSGGSLCDATPSISTAHLQHCLWYLGGPNGNDFHPKYEKIISAILTKQQIPENHVLFMGSSMGGFMALKMAEYFLKAYAYAYNAQVDVSISMWENTEGLLQWLGEFSSSDQNYLSPELRNRMILHPEKIINDDRSIFLLQNKADGGHYRKHFLPFQHWTRQNPQTRDLLFYHISLGEMEIPPLHKGLNAVEFNHPCDNPHCFNDKEDEYSFVDRMLRFMAQQDAARREAQEGAP
jgi:hypothetical protein